ncbi:hypothetical protein TL08_13570 [Actinoalloteichus hymeniacidonis]|uniref:Uncharacterized protein n=1 Tax=Actinoalloteichus hymeniacidonis TaxID=340345 RepID=A0AAC9HQI8_9PSEU|nr:hypothetical protein TL08_13570 [Actinoalloteichus hymeniacidonis]
MIARALPAGHPALGTDGPDGAAAPVLLCEPRRALLIDDGAGSETELQIEMIVQAGFGGRIAEPSADVDTARGWTLRLLDGELQLSDQEDGLWARTPLELDPAWSAAAAAAGHVVVLYGFRLGVRQSGGIADASAQTDTDAVDAEELRGACAHGWVVAARVDWAG